MLDRRISTVADRRRKDELIATDHVAVANMPVLQDLGEAGRHLPRLRRTK